MRRRACLSTAVDDVYVATCDEEIFEAVTQNGGHALMTANTHERCTDRVEEAAEALDHDLIVIVQGDEPLFNPQVLEILLEPMHKDDNTYCTNLLSIIHDKENLRDIDIVKTVMDQSGFIMYFSRSPIPYVRVRNNCPMYRQTGISAFTRAFLNTYSSLAPTPLEIAESVDFLRILEHGYAIRGIPYEGKTVGVERERDVKIVEKILTEDPIQNRIYRKILET